MPQDIAAIHSEACALPFRTQAHKAPPKLTKHPSSPSRPHSHASSLSALVSSHDPARCAHPRRRRRRDGQRHLLCALSATSRAHSEWQVAVGVCRLRERGARASCAVRCDHAALRRAISRGVNKPAAAVTCVQRRLRASVWYCGAAIRAVKRATQRATKLHCNAAVAVSCFTPLFAQLFTVSAGAPDSLGTLHLADLSPSLILPTFAAHAQGRPARYRSGGGGEAIKSGASSGRVERGSDAARGASSGLTQRARVRGRHLRLGCDALSQPADGRGVRAGREMRRPPPLIRCASCSQKNRPTLTAPTSPPRS